MPFEPYVRFLIFSSVRVTEWPPIGEKLLTRLTIRFLVYVPKCHFSLFPTPRFMKWEYLSDCDIS